MHAGYRNAESMPNVLLASTPTNVYALKITLEIQQLNAILVGFK